MNETELREYLAAKFADVTLDTLPSFMADALDREHDYGTICIAVGACAVAAAKAADRHPNGGITGFQASAVFWEFVRGWGTFGDGPKRMVSYRDMLYPQYEEKFDKRISAETWVWLQDEARKKVPAPESAHPAVLAHWQSIADGVIPFGYSVEDES